MLDPTISYIRQEHIVDEKTLQEVLQEQQSSGQSLVSILRQKNLVDEEQLTRIIAVANKIEFVNLSPEMIEPIAAHMVTYEIASHNNIIPVKKQGNNLVVAMSSPLNLAVRDQIAIRTGCRVVPIAATPSAIKQAITYHFNVQNVTKQAIASMRFSRGADEERAKDASAESKALRVAEDPITKLVSLIITSAIDAQASDIHIEPNEPDVRVRYRIDGLLRDAIDVPSSAQKEVASRIKVLADMDISEKRLPQDGHIALQHEGKDYDLRISSLPNISGEKIVIRILDKSTSRWTLDEVVTSADDNEKFRSLLANPYGMFLLTGPTGCGKTTTLYSALQLLSTPDKNIVTVEDPVEYRLDGITQVQIKPAAGVNFASALRSILRQDPDIILVGEIRDSETAEIAVSAALTGHLVLSTLHTNDAAGAISRLINLGVPPFLVAAVLLGAAAQRLVRIICPKCKTSHSPSSEELEQLFGSAKRDGRIQLQRGKGCNNCYYTGYRGRKAVYEVLQISPAIRKLIVEGADDDTIKNQAITEGMRTLCKSALEEVLKGTTTFEEVQRVIDVRAK
jgi:type IV pilus assembly protein PilB